MGNDILRLEVGPLLGSLPVIEDILHQRWKAHQGSGTFLAQGLRTRVSRPVAPGADVKFVERVGPGLALFLYALEARSLSPVASPWVSSRAEITERGGFGRRHARHVRDALA